MKSSHLRIWGLVFQVAEHIQILFFGKAKDNPNTSYEDTWESCQDCGM